MSKHTPGPWRINTAGMAKHGEPFKVTEIYVYAPNTQDDTAICSDVIDPVTQEPSEANARLIAAAPDLLEALRDFSAYVHAEQSATDGAVQYSNTQIHRLVFKARAAIAKAEG